MRSAIERPSPLPPPVISVVLPESQVLRNGPNASAIYPPERLKRRPSDCRCAHPRPVVALQLEHAVLHGACRRRTPTLSALASAEDPLGSSGRSVTTVTTRPDARRSRLRRMPRPAASVGVLFSCFWGGTDPPGRVDETRSLIGCHSAFYHNRRGPTRDKIKRSTSPLGAGEGRELSLWPIAEERRSQSDRRKSRGRNVRERRRRSGSSASETG